jgi:hypothetical protein
MSRYCVIKPDGHAERPYLVNDELLDRVIARFAHSDEADKVVSELGKYDWKPIETAPKGARAIVCGGVRNCVDGYHDVQAAWIDGLGNVWADDRKEGAAPIKPTYWMPLREPPK